MVRDFLKFLKLSFFFESMLGSVLAASGGLCYIPMDGCCGTQTFLCEDRKKPAINVTGTLELVSFEKNR